MSGFKEPGFADRQKAAAQARANILEKFRARPGADDPAVKAREAERAQIAANRAKAKETREAEKAERKRREAEAAAAEAARIAREKAEAAEREAALEAEQKAKRDARKDRGKKKRYGGPKMRRPAASLRRTSLRTDETSVLLHRVVLLHAVGHGIGLHRVLFHAVVFLHGILGHGVFLLHAIALRHLVLGDRVFMGGASLV